MTRRAVLICPGRGTYDKAELGYLGRYHDAKAPMLAQFDALRLAEGQIPLTALDAAPQFAAATHMKGAAASPLIYACAYADAMSLADDIEVVAVTGNSMGWYIALAVAGVLSAIDGFKVVNTMGRLMQDANIGGQLIYPFVSDDWVPDVDRRKALLSLVAEIDARAGHTLDLSIDLGGMLVLAGNANGLGAFEKSVPSLQGRFPMRLPHHGAFHTRLQAPVAKLGRSALPPTMFGQPGIPLIDGRGGVWWPHASEPADLWDYTLGHQVTETYDFTLAIRVAALEFAPDLFVITGPGTTLGGAVAQSLVAVKWRGMHDKTSFQARQETDGLLVKMGDPADRFAVI